MADKMAEPHLPPDVNRGYILLTVSAVTFSVAFILLCLRLFVRTKIVRGGLGWDDLFIILGVIGALTVLGMSIAVVHFGNGRHIYYLSSEEIIQGIKWSLIIDVVSILSTMFTRASVYVFLLRLFTTRKPWKWSLHLITAFNVITGLLAATTVLTSCRPAEKNWDPTVRGSCRAPIVKNVINSLQSAASMFCDWALAFLPAVFLWNVQISFRIKAGICCLMGLGFITGVFALARTILLIHLPTEDISYNILNLSIWATVEQNVAIITACIPTIRPLFRPQSIEYLRSHLVPFRLSTFPNRNGHTIHSIKVKPPNHRCSVHCPQISRFSFQSDLEHQSTASEVAQTDTSDFSDAITKLSEGS